MAFEIFRDPQQGAGFVLCVVTIPICILATILRFSGTIRASRKIQWEDWFALLALIFHLLYATMFLFSKFPTPSRSKRCHIWYSYCRLALDNCPSGHCTFRSKLGNTTSLTASSFDRDERNVFARVDNATAGEADQDHASTSTRARPSIYHPHCASLAWPLLETT